MSKPDRFEVYLNYKLSAIMMDKVSTQWEV